MLKQLLIVEVSFHLAKPSKNLSCSILLRSPECCSGLFSYSPSSFSPLLTLLFVYFLQAKRSIYAAFDMGKASEPV